MKCNRIRIDGGIPIAGRDAAAVVASPSVRQAKSYIRCPDLRVAAVMKVVDACGITERETMVILPYSGWGKG